MRGWVFQYGPVTYSVREDRSIHHLVKDSIAGPSKWACCTFVCSDVENRALEILRRCKPGFAAQEREVEVFLEDLLEEVSS